MKSFANFEKSANCCKSRTRCCAEIQRSPQAATRQRNSADSRDGQTHIAPRRGFSLVELLITVAIIGIFVGMVVTSLEPNYSQQVLDSIRLVESELNYARNLAISNGSTYRVTFSSLRNRLILTHAGSNTNLNTLPPSPFANPGDSATAQVLDFELVPHVGSASSLVGCYTADSTFTSLSSIDFNPYGGTGSAVPSVIYVAAGNADDRWYVSATVNALTGLVTIGTPTKALPGSEFQNGGGDDSGGGEEGGGGGGGGEEGGGDGGGAD